MNKRKLTTIINTTYVISCLPMLYLAASKLFKASIHSDPFIRPTCSKPMIAYFIFIGIITAAMLISNDIISKKASDIIKKTAAVFTCIIALPVLAVLLLKNMICKTGNASVTGSARIVMAALVFIFYLFGKHSSEQKEQSV